MNEQRLAVYVTLYERGMMVEWFAVCEDGSVASDLWNDGHCEPSKAPSALAKMLSEWLSATTGAPSPS